MRDYINQQRQEVAIKTITQTEELRGQDAIRQKRVDGQFETMKSQLGEM